MRLHIATCALALLLSGTARADVCVDAEVDCQAHAIDFADRSGLFDAIEFDTGFVPAGSPFQLRAAFFLGAGTHVGMSGELVAEHPPAVELSAVGRSGAGMLELDFGLEAKLTGRLVVLEIDETFDIPIPGVPSDLRFHALEFFDPFLIGPLAVPVEVEDTIERFTLLTVDLLDLIAPIPGFDGGLRIDVQGTLAVEYRGDRLEIEEVGSLTSPASVVSLPPHLPEGYGGSRELSVVKHGALRYEGTLVLYPSLFVTLFGVDAFETDIASIPIPIAELETPIRFDPAEVTLVFADVDVEPLAIDFGVLAAGQREEELLRVFNDGEAELRWTLPETAGPFRPARTEGTLAPGTSGYVRVAYEPDAAGTFSETIALETNDPDTPRVEIALSGEAFGLPPIEPGDGGLVADAGDAGLDGGLDGGLGDGGAGDREALAGCGCAASGAGGLPWVEIALLAAALRVRRRRVQRRAGPSA